MTKFWWASLLGILIFAECTHLSTSNTSTNQSQQNLTMQGGQRSNLAEALTSAEAHPGPDRANRSASIEHPQIDRSTRLQLLKGYGALPLSFEKNEGQADTRVEFLSHNAGYTVYLTADEAILSLSEGRSNNNRTETSEEKAQPPAVDSQVTSNESDERTMGYSLGMKLGGANPKAPISGLDELPGKSNYFVSNDPKKWHTDIANYARVKYSGVYPGVDLVYHGNKGQLEYDFVVAPSANPKSIRFSVAAIPTPRTMHRAGMLRITADGDLMMKMSGGEIRFHKPIAYQTNPSGVKNYVETRYVLGRGQSQISFAVASYDRRRPLVIDPVLSYSTYLGPSGGVYSIAVDASGNAYVTGGNTSTGFPTTPGAFQTTCPGSCYPNPAAFVAKLNSTGSALVYSTYLSGSGGAFGESIAVDSAGDAYVAGEAGSNFPTTSGAFQTICPGCTGYSQAAFITKLNPSGSALVYSTYLGGSVGDYAGGIALDASDNAYVTGGTSSSNFPVTPGCFQLTYQAGGDAFVTELNSTGSALVYSTYLGGGSSAGGKIVVNTAGNAYVEGETQSPSFPTTAGAFATTCSKCSSGTDPGGHPLQDVFVTEFNTNGSALVYSTFLGGSNGDFPEGIALDASGNAYVTGSTYSNDFPVTPGAFQTTCGGGNCSGQAGDMFLLKLNSTGSALVYSTYVGGSGYDVGTGIVVDSTGDAYVGGGTSSLDFPATVGAFQTVNKGGNAFLVEVNPSGSAILYSTFLGGSGGDNANAISLDASGGIYIAGQANSRDFPTTPGAFQAAALANLGAFIAKFTFGSAQSGPVASVVPANLNFGTMTVGATSSSQTITLASTGTTTLVISIGISGTNSGNFAQTNNCGGSLAAGSSCKIIVTFNPTAAGTASASVVINDNALDSPQSVSLTGIGRGFSLSAATGSNCPAGGNCSTSATVTAGQTATYNLQAAPVGGFSGTVTLSCGDTLAKSSCQFSSYSVGVNGSAASGFAVTVTTTAGSMLEPYWKPTSRRAPVQPLLTLSFLFVLALLIASAAAHERHPRPHLVPALALLILSLVWISGCSHAVSSGGGNGGTPYTMMITGTSNGVSQSLPLNLTIR